MSDFVREVKDAYESAVDAWVEGPVLVYCRLAEALVETSPRPLAGCRVLDLGAGTGVVSSVLARAGARPVGVDLAEAMLRHHRAHRPPAIVGDALALPCRMDSFDAVVAGFSINHLPDPSAGLAECRRVLRPGGLLLASTFPVDGDHPAKAAVESVLARFGYQRPSWYDEFKASTAARTGDPHRLVEVATTAGLTGVEVQRLEVTAGLDDPDLAVAWRLNMPHTIGFVTTLSGELRARLVAEAVAALPRPLLAEVPMLVLHAHA